VQAALANLLAFHLARHARSSAATIEAFVRDRMLAVQAFGQPRPREAWRRLRYVVAQARRLAASGQPGLRSVLDWLEELQRERFYDAESTIPEGDEDAVRFMTVHGSKGLEFPIVILTGLGAIRRRPAGPHIAANHRAGQLDVYVNGWFATGGFDQQREAQLDQAEQVRLLYVATTRARDHLVLSLFHTARETESQAGRILQGLSEAPHLCPSIPLADSRPAPAWRPALVPEPVSPDAHQSAEAAWLASRQGLIDSLARERRCTATSLSRLPAPDEETDEIELTTGEGAETPHWFPRGRAATAWGLAVHAVLQAIDLRTLEGLDALAGAVAAGYGIREQTARIANLARAAAESWPVRAAIASGRFHREVPVGISWQGTLLEGYIDLLYEREDGSLTVIDYKTDHITAGELGVRMGHYQLQGGAYAMALEQATARTVSSVEFVFAALGQSVALERPAVVRLASQVARLLAS
ncbi:MAG TPA: 3'-5' exonuclease, partial [Chloroflexota bacterium]|nr:3'-5' exonuclease [Chloroflexota bacterium]